MFSLPLLPRTLAACERDIESKVEQVRLAVAKDLGRLGDASNQTQRFSLLARCLDDAAGAVRKQALLSIADLGAIAMRDRVFGLLSDPDLAVRQMAVLTLGEIVTPDDHEVTGRLAGLLRAGSPPIRYQALLAYANLCPDCCEEDLHLALTDSDPEIRRLAVRLIDEVLIPRNSALQGATLSTLLSCAQDDDVQLALLAQLVCGELEVKAPRQLIVSVVERRMRVAEPRDEQWAIELCGRLDLTQARVGLRRRAFGRWGFSTDPFRWLALGVLARMGDSQALDALLSQLTARSYVKREMAIQALGSCGRNEAWVALVAHRGRLSDAVDERVKDEQAVLDAALLALQAERQTSV
jgi:HEAT repeat protein